MEGKYNLPYILPLVVQMMRSNFLSVEDCPLKCCEHFGVNVIFSHFVTMSTPPENCSDGTMSECSSGLVEQPPLPWALVQLVSSYVDWSAVDDRVQVEMQIRRSCACFWDNWWQS